MTDPGIEGDPKFLETMQLSKNSLNIYTVEFAVWTTAPPCWRKQSCLSTFNEEIKFIISSW
jgi:hypothetical protein